jgi:hypothetical protein
MLCGLCSGTWRCGAGRTVGATTGSTSGMGSSLTSLWAGLGSGSDTVVEEGAARCAWIGGSWPLFAPIQ